MSNSNGKITKPVTTTDVSTVLGVASHNVSVLCTSDKIKAWAKYKPVKHSKVTELTEADRKSVQYGIINIPRFSNHAFMAMFMYKGSPAPLSGAKSAYWVYDKPSTGNPKRLGDFNGYWNSPIEPIGPIAGSEIVVNHDTGDPDFGYVNFDFPVATDERNLKISDFDLAQLNSPSTAGAPFYLGVCITDGVGVNNSTNPNDYPGTRLMTQQTAINNSLTTVTVNGTKCARISVPYAQFMAKVPPSGQVMIFAFLSNSAISTFSEPKMSGGDIIPLNMSGKMMSLITGNRFQVTWVSVTATKLTGGGSGGQYMGFIDFSADIKNQTNTAQTIGGGMVYLSRNNNSVATETFIGSTRTIEAGATISISGTFPISQSGDYSVRILWEPGAKETHDMTQYVNAPS